MKILGIEYTSFIIKTMKIEKFVFKAIVFGKVD